MVLIISAVGVAIGADLPLRAAAWLAPGGGHLAALSTAPVECFVAPPDTAQAALAAAGRIVFRSPLLLGGPAAKAGLSCQACHVNGHDNPQFFIAGLSSAPGTADVTSSRFSKTRGDGVFNPRTIPSLTGIGALAPAAAADRALHIERFVHGVIVEEFQGWKPAPRVFDALLAYLSALDVRTCPDALSAPIRLGDDLARIAGGAAAMRQALEDADPELADFLVVSLRALLGEVYERFDQPDQEPARATLLRLSADLGNLRPQVTAAPKQAVSALVAWQHQLEEGQAGLLPLEPHSLYNPERLRAPADP